MADFVQSANVKSAVRKLADPIADVAAFNTLVQSVITGNPFACVSYMTAGVTHDPVEKTKEGYTVKIVYQDSDAKTVGNLSDKFDTMAGFTAGAAAILANAALSTAHGGTAVRDTEKESNTATRRSRTRYWTCENISARMMPGIINRMNPAITAKTMRIVAPKKGRNCGPV